MKEDGDKKIKNNPKSCWEDDARQSSMESGVSEGFNVSSASESGISYCKMPGVAG